jgi:hypothetical protein
MPSKVQLTTIAEMIADPLLAAIPLFPKPESRNNNGLVLISFWRMRERY